MSSCREGGTAWVTLEEGAGSSGGGQKAVKKVELKMSLFLPRGCRWLAVELTVNKSVHSKLISDILEY